MSTPADWIPIEWPASWSAGQLGLLRDTPFNAIAFPASKKEEAPPAGVVEAAKAAGLTVPAVTWQAWKDIDWSKSDGIAAIGDGFWPAYNYKGMADGSAGPTGEPWLDANGWLYLYARARAGQRVVWLRSDPPEDPRTVRQPHLQLLLAEAFAYGGRRPLWLPPAFANALAAGNEQALKDWKKLADTARWFEQRKEWRSWPAVAPLVILSDFSGDNEYVAGETMLLAARKQVPFWPVSTAQATASDLAGRRSVLYLDPAPPDPKLLALLKAFATNGGLVLAGPACAKAFAGLKPVAASPHPRFDILALGRGRVAVARAVFDDPWTLADDAHLMTSKRYDPARLFNGGLLHTHTAASPDGKRSIVHIVNYGTEPFAHVVALQVTRSVRSARIHIPGEAESRVARPSGHPARPELTIPHFSVYLAVELEHAHA
jgi:hypothetical protein